MVKILGFEGWILKLNTHKNGPTIGTLRPGIYPIGSPESRAAARMLARQKDEQAERLEVILSGRVCRVSGNPKLPSATAWMQCANGKLMRGLIVPDGMSTDEARRIVDSIARSQ
jgi:hypothetical protein